MYFGVEEGVRGEPKTEERALKEKKAMILNRRFMSEFGGNERYSWVKVDAALSLAYPGAISHLVNIHRYYCIPFVWLYRREYMARPWPSTWKKRRIKTRWWIAACLHHYVHQCQYLLLLHLLLATAVASSLSMGFCVRMAPFCSSTSSEPPLDQVVFLSSTNVFLIVTNQSHTSFSALSLS